MVLDVSVSVEACVIAEEPQDEVLWVAEEQHVEPLEEEVRNTRTGRYAEVESNELHLLALL